MPTPRHTVKTEPTTGGVKVRFSQKSSTKQTKGMMSSLAICPGTVGQLWGGAVHALVLIHLVEPDGVDEQGEVQACDGDVRHNRKDEGICGVRRKT
jgi:hypothetical protein